MTTPDRTPRQARFTDQDIRQLISRVSHMSQQLDQVLNLLNAQPPATPKAISDEERFYPGVGTVTNGQRPLSPVQLQALAALDAREE